jgi:hypothetical protein
MSGNKSERSLSPAAVSEEGRRELIARQHRALYGNESPAFYPPGSFGDDSHSARAENTASGTPTSGTGGVRGPSPRGADPFGLGPQGPAEGTVQGTTASSVTGRQSPSRANSTSSPISGANPSYSLYDAGAEQPATSTSSPGGADSPSSRQMSSKAAPAPIGSSVGPIGSRPSQPASAQAPYPPMNKRSTTPLPSPLGFGFAPNESAHAGGSGNQRSTSAASNPASSAHATGNKETANPVGLGWGNSSGVWGSKNLGVQASVWG